MEIEIFLKVEKNGAEESFSLLLDIFTFSTITYVRIISKLKKIKCFFKKFLRLVFIFIELLPQFENSPFFC